MAPLLLMQEATLADVLDLVQTAVTEAALPVTSAESASTESGYRVLDRADQWVHLGFVLTAPRSRNTDLTDGRTHVHIEDTLVVELRIDVARVAGQVALLRTAGLHEQAIRAAVLGADQRYRPSFVDANRSYTPDRRWLAVRLSFTVERFERAGVAA